MSRRSVLLSRKSVRKGGGGKSRRVRRSRGSTRAKLSILSKRRVRSIGSGKRRYLRKRRGGMNGTDKTVNRLENLERESREHDKLLRMLIKKDGDDIQIADVVGLEETLSRIHTALHDKTMAKTMAKTKFEMMLNKIKLINQALDIELFGARVAVLDELVRNNYALGTTYNSLKDAEPPNDIIENLTRVEERHQTLNATPYKFRLVPGSEVDVQLNTGKPLGMVLQSVEGNVYDESNSRLGGAEQAFTWVYDVQPNTQAEHKGIRVGQVCIKVNHDSRIRATSADGDNNRRSARTTTLSTRPSEIYLIGHKGGAVAVIKRLMDESAENMTLKLGEVELIETED